MGAPNAGLIAGAAMRQGSRSTSYTPLLSESVLIWWRAEVEIIRRALRRSGWRPRLDDRESSRARAATALGYRDPVILDAVRRAQEQVATTRLGFERDGVWVQGESPDWRVISVVAAAAASLRRAVDVIDVGGSLASVYLRCLPILELLPISSWTIVEQPHFVEVGQQELEPLYPQLSFKTSLSRQTECQNPDVVLFQSSLQYLDDPISDLKLVTGSTQWLLVDKTPMTSGRPVRAIQRVRTGAYSTSYPMQILSSTQILAAVTESLRVVDEWSNDDQPEKTRQGVKVTWGGLLAVRQLPS